MEKRNNSFKFDFMPTGQAIKQVREARGVTRARLSEITGYAPRYIQAIENEGKVPRVALLVQLATMFDVSIDEHIFKNKQVAKSSIRRRVDALLNGLEDKDLIVIEGTAKGIYAAKEQE